MTDSAGDSDSGALFIKEQAAVRFPLQRFAEANRFDDFGQTQTPALLAALQNNPAPSRQPFRRGLLEPTLAADSLDWGDAFDPELRGLFENPLEPLKLDERGIERHSHGGLFRRQLLQGSKDHAFLPRGLYFCKIDVAVIRELVFLSGFDTQHLRKMPGIVSDKLCMMIVYFVYEKSAACHVR